jgi:hypothetical protein
MAARERIKALTIYDSRYHRETLLADVRVIRATSWSGAIFTLIMAALVAATVALL